MIKKQKNITFQIRYNYYTKKKEQKDSVPDVRVVINQRQL